MHCQGERCKPGKEPKIGDELSIRQGFDERRIKVEALSAVDEGSAAALPLVVEAANTMSAEERARLLRVGRRAAAAQLGLR